MRLWRAVQRGAGMIAVVGLIGLGSLSGVLAQGGGGSPAAGLIWEASGAPGQSSAGRLVWLSPEAEPVVVADVPNESGGMRVLPCGADAVSPDGSALLIFGGGETGGLFNVTLGAPAESTLTRWGDAQVLACNGRGRATFSPDGARWAYLEYEVSETATAYPDGMLHVMDAADGSVQQSFENVTAFALLDDVVYHMQFFANNQGLADEAALFRWDGDRAEEVMTFIPAANCNWRSAALDVHAARDRVLISLGEQCQANSHWRVFTLDADGTQTEHVNLQTGGGYLPWPYINQIYFLPGDSSATQAVGVYPHGRAGNVGNLVHLELADNAVTLITAEVTVDAYPDGNAGHMVLAPDGSALAYVSSTANGAQTLHRLRLSGDLHPLDISPGGAGDVIGSMFFRPNGDLLYVAGGVDGADNALFLLPAGGDEPQRVVRGRFMQNSGTAGQDTALLMEQVPPDDDHRNPAYNVVAISLPDGERAVLLAGRETDTFGYPLVWQGAIAPPETAEPSS